MNEINVCTDPWRMWYWDPDTGVISYFILKNARRFNVALLSKRNNTFGAAYKTVAKLIVKYPEYREAPAESTIEDLTRRLSE